MEMASNL